MHLILLNSCLQYKKIVLANKINIIYCRNLYIYTIISIQIYIRNVVWIHTNVRTYIHTHIYIYIHTHTQTHTHTSVYYFFVEVFKFVLSGAGYEPVYSAKDDSTTSRRKI